MAIATFNVGIKGIIVKDGKVLLLRGESKGKNFLDAPGGRIDENETIQETLVRELNEELPGIKNIQIGKLLSAYRLPGLPFGDKGLTLLWYKVEAELPEPVVVSDEHDIAVWLPIKEAMQETAGGVGQAIENL